MSLSDEKMLPNSSDYGEHETGALDTIHPPEEHSHNLSPEHDRHPQPPTTGGNVKGRRNSLDSTFNMNSAFKQLSGNISVQNQPVQTGEAQQPVTKDSPEPVTESIHSPCNPVPRNGARHRRSHAISKRGCGPYSRSMRNRPLRPALQIQIPNQRIFLDTQGYEQLAPAGDIPRFEVTRDASVPQDVEDKKVISAKEDQGQRQADGNLSEQFSALAEGLQRIHTSTQVSPDRSAEPKEESKDMDVD